MSAFALKDGRSAPAFSGKHEPVNMTVSIQFHQLY